MLVSSDHMGCQLLYLIKTIIIHIQHHVAFSLLRLCASFCKHIHLSRTTPPSLCSDSLKFCDDEVRSCLSSCLADPNWTQAQLSPSMGGFGLRSLSGHSPAAFISSLAASRFGNLDNVHLQQEDRTFVWPCCCLSFVRGQG